MTKLRWSEGPMLRASNVVRGAGRWWTWIPNQGLEGVRPKAEEKSDLPDFYGGGKWSLTCPKGLRMMVLLEFKMFSSHLLVSPSKKENGHSIKIYLTILNIHIHCFFSQAIHKMVFTACNTWPDAAKQLIANLLNFNR